MSNWVRISTSIDKNLLDELCDKNIKRSECLDAGAKLLLGKRKDHEVMKIEVEKIRNEYSYLKDLVTKTQLQIMLLGEAWKNKYNEDPLLDLWEKTR